MNMNNKELKTKLDTLYPKRHPFRREAEEQLENELTVNRMLEGRGIIQDRRSVLNYLAGKTDFDPILAKHMLGRFLNPER